MNQKYPIKDMIPINEFAKYSDKDVNEIIAWIKDGSYLGKEVNGEWYIAKYEFDLAFPDKVIKTWKDHLISSLWLGMAISGLWMVIAIVIMGANTSGAAGMSNLLGNAFGVFSITCGISFLIKLTGNGSNKFE